VKSLLGLCLFILLGAGLAGAQTPPVPSPVFYTAEVLAVYPHDVGAYTQGLLWHEGFLYESAAPRPLGTRSSLRRVDLVSGEVLARRTLHTNFEGAELFVEGLALVGDELIQLTWKNGVAFRYALEDFAFLGEFRYATQGWGLCYDGEALYMSDGTPTLYVRDPANFELLAEITVTYEGQPVPNLNELECVGETIFANVYQNEIIVMIDKATGVITGLADMRGLLSAEERAALPDADRNAVLNGIAYNPEAGVFYVTGKLWPKLFEVRFVEAQG